MPRGKMLCCPYVSGTVVFGKFVAWFECETFKIVVWPALLLSGLAVQQAGWWSLYGDLGNWCGLVGGAMALVGLRLANMEF